MSWSIGTPWSARTRRTVNRTSIFRALMDNFRPSSTTRRGPMISYRTACPIRVAEACGHGTVGPVAGNAREILCVFVPPRGLCLSTGDERMCGLVSHMCRRAARMWEVDRLFIAARGRTVLPDPLTHVVRDCHYSPLFITDLPVIQKPRIRSSLPMAGALRPERVL